MNNAQYLDTLFGGRENKSLGLNLVPLGVYTLCAAPRRQKSDQNALERHAPCPLTTLPLMLL